MRKPLILIRIWKIIPFFLIVFLIVSSSAYSQLFQNLKVSQDFDTVKIKYDISGGRPNDFYKIKLAVSEDGGKTYPLIPKTVQGDIGDNVPTGKNKLITWEPLKDSVQLIGKDFKFNLTGKIIGGPKNIDLVKVKGGTFVMGDQFGNGSANETYLHKVKLADFEIGAYEITNVQFALFLRQYGDDHVKSGEFKGKPMIFETKDGLTQKKAADQNYYWVVKEGKEYNPVVGVTWYGANEFCKFYGYRLPTEAEWEYAARERGKKVRFGDGQDTAQKNEFNFDGVTKVVNDSKLEGKSKNNTVRIGSYDPNSLGLYDMSGNVWDWCQDWYKNNYYLHSASVEPTGPWLGEYKVIRGGSWYSSAYGIRTTVRSFSPPSIEKDDIGFRVAKFIKK